MHREVRALPLWIELLDLVIAGDSWSPDLNDVHVVTRHVDLTEASHELSDQALLSPPIMKARVILSEVVGARMDLQSPPEVPARRLARSIRTICAGAGSNAHEIAGRGRASRRRARGRQGELRHQYRVGQFVAFHGQDADGGEEQYVH